MKVLQIQFQQTYHLRQCQSHAMSNWNSLKFLTYTWLMCPSKSSDVAMRVQVITKVTASCCRKRKHNVLSSQFYCSHSRYSAKVILFTFMSIQNHIWHNKMQTKIIIDSVGHIYIFPSLSNWRQRLQKSYFTWRAWTNEPKQSVSLREEIWKRKSQGKFQVVSLVSSFFVTAKQVHFPILNTQHMIL